MTKPLAHNPFESIPLHCRADMPANDDAQLRRSSVVQPSQLEATPSLFAATLKDTLKEVFRMEPCTAWQSGHEEVSAPK